MSAFWAPLAELLQENYESFCSFWGRSESRSPGYDMYLVILRVQLTLGCLKRILISCSLLDLSTLSQKYYSYFVLNCLFTSQVHCRLERNLAHLKELWLSESFWIQCSKEHLNPTPSNSVNTQGRRTGLLLIKLKYLKNILQIFIYIMKSNKGQYSNKCKSFTSKNVSYFCHCC